MIRKTFFWLHLSLGVAAGIFIFIMAATGVLLAFERQAIDFADRDIRSVVVPNDAQPRPMSDLLEAVRLAGMGEPTAIVLRNQPQAAMQFSLGRGKTVYVDPYSGAILGLSSLRAHEFFATVEQWHRSLGSKTTGRWLTGISNLLFGALILFGLVLWFPRKWSWQSVRARLLFQTKSQGKASEWNWHHVLGIWCAPSLLVIALSGVVMSFPWANALLYRLSGSPLPTSDRRPRPPQTEPGTDPNYDHLFTIAKTLNPNWRTISLTITRDVNAPAQAAIDAGSGGQPQYRTQYLLAQDTGTVIKKTSFSDGSLGQRLRAFVRFGHTGEYYGFIGQLIAAIASIAACVLVYTGLSLSIRRLKRMTASIRADYPKTVSEPAVKS